jgi:hypothetical protein
MITRLAVALEVLQEDLAAVVGEDGFLDEIRTTAKLQHPEGRRFIVTCEVGLGAIEDTGDGLE